MPSEPSPGAELRVGVIGAGPAGVYVADALTKQDADARIDIFDRLPAPFGLLRYGVAPDHLKMKTLAGTLQKVLDHPGVRFFGNVELGKDITAAELLGDYHAVVYTFGASVDRGLGIPGDDLPGNVAATDFVNWYCGHPDAAAFSFDLSAEQVAVVGLGNVALDVARILIRDPEELVGTDVPDTVLNALRESKVREVHIVGRRGPVNVKFTIKELREMGELAGVDVVVDPAHFAEVPDELDRAITKLVSELRSWSTRTTTGAGRRLHVHFNAPTVAVLGTDRVAALAVRRGEGVAEIPVGMVFRSIGYLGIPAPDVPFDEGSSTIPTIEHRVVGGIAAPGEYAAGWIKRGATGVIGTNRSDATETVAVLLADRDALLARPVTPGSALELVEKRVQGLVTLAGWAAIDAAEVALGAGRGSPRIKVHTWSGLLDAAAPPTA